MKLQSVPAAEDLNNSHFTCGKQSQLSTCQSHHEDYLRRVQSEHSTHLLPLPA